MNEIVLWFNSIYNVGSLFVNSVIFQIKSIDWRTHATNLFLLYCKIASQVKTSYSFYYDNYSIFRDFADTCVYGVKYLVSGALNRRIEPLHTNWISCSYLSFNKSLYQPQYNFVEYFVPIYGDVMEDFSLLEYFKEWFKISLDEVNNENNLIIDAVITTKSSSNRYCRVCNSKNKDIPMSLSDTKSNIRFISIDIYMPAISKDPYVLDLDTDSYLVDNVLFTPAFVRRLMEYNVNSSTFDINYTVKIMDNNIHSFELDSTQYIILEKDGYKIITNC
uniref:Uncharacterized protein n=1 Tax=viral metagenome TaxID=1070528 RepID=A0A6C0DPG3_9ZZZZ